MVILQRLLRFFSILVSAFAIAESTSQMTPVPDCMTIPKPGSVKPAGWLKEWALAAANGYTRRMDAVDEEFRKAWAADFKPDGEQMAWWKGSWSFEGGAYWFDGLVRLAFQLDDTALKALAEKRLAPVLDNMNNNAIAFCWWLDRNNPDHVKTARSHGTWMTNWVPGMSARAIAAWYEATGDKRAANAIIFALGTDFWCRSYYATSTLPGGTYESWRLTGADELKNALQAYARKIQSDPRKSDYGVLPWDGLEKSLHLHRKEERALHLRSRHGVNANENMLSLFAAYRISGDRRFLDRVRAWYAFFDKNLRLPFGAMVMDEEWGAPGPLRGAETCAIAAEMWTRINLLAGLGEGSWGDDVEQTFFNAVPACVDRAFKQHVYLQQPNRLEPSCNRRFSVIPENTCTQYASKHHPLCCTAAVNRLLPNYIQAMWLNTRDGGIAASLYGPCTFQTTRNGEPIAIAEETSYPFNDTIAVRFTNVSSKPFPVRFRIPGWCKNPDIRLNGKPCDFIVKDGFAAIAPSMPWKIGDAFSLTFPMRPRMTVMRDYDETMKEYASVHLGPLLLAKPFIEKTPNEPGEPTSTPVVRLDKLLKTASLTQTPPGSPWNWPYDAPVKLTVQDAKGAPLLLIPYGCCKFRASMLEVEPAMPAW